MYRHTCIFKLCCISTPQSLQGFSDAVITPSIIALCQQVGVNYAQVTNTLVAKNVGILVGSFGGALLLDVFIVIQNNPFFESVHV